MRGFLPDLQEAAQREDQVHRSRQGEQFTDHTLTVMWILDFNGIQGDTSHCSLGSVDMKTKVAI